MKYLTHFTNIIHELVKSGKLSKSDESQLNKLIKLMQHSLDTKNVKEAKKIAEALGKKLIDIFSED